MPSVSKTKTAKMTTAFQSTGEAAARVGGVGRAGGQRERRGEERST